MEHMHQQKTEKKNSLFMIASGRLQEDAKKEKTTDKVPGPSPSDNRQPPSNNQPEVSETTDLAQPSTSASGDTSCLETGAGQEEGSQAREANG